MLSRYACPCCGVDGTTKEAKKALEALEKEVGHLIITSSYRCDKHNHEVGGAASSQHLKGKAFDILIGQDSSRTKLLYAAKKIGFMGYGLGHNFVHIDLRETFCIWEYK